MISDDSNSGTENLINDRGLPPVPPEKAKKPPIWTWKGLKALTNGGNRKFNCCFSLLVHSIDGLPPIFDDECLVVHWKRRDTHQMTHPVRVSQGAVQIEQQLTHSCSVHGGQNGPHNLIKYEAKHFLLYVSVYNAAELSLGKHRVDMTRMLPLTLGELEEESSGKWATGFKLSGKARGATMNVSFGYVMINSKSKSVPESPRVKLTSPFEVSSIRRVGSLPANLSMLNQPSEDVNDLHEDFPTKLSESMNVLYQKLDEEMSSDRILVENDKVCSENKLDFGPDSFAGEKVSETEWDVSEFTKQQVELEENVSREVPGIGDDVDVPPAEEVMISQKDEHEEKEVDVCFKESLMKEIETVLSQITDLADEGIDPHEDENDALHQEDSSDIMNHCYRESTLNLDDVTEAVANDFLDMLSQEHTPWGLNSETELESPRNCVLKQFEKDALGIKNDPEIPLFSPWEAISNDLHTHEVFEAMPNLPLRIKARASRLEDLECEAMKKDVFQHSLPSNNSSGFESPVEEPPNGLLPLAGDLDPFMCFSKSMCPSLFANAKNKESLAMQVSTALRNENLSMQEEKVVNEDKTVCEENVTIPQFKIHVSRLKVESGKKKKLWGSAGEERVGSRWLIANGMGKKKKHPLMKAKVVTGLVRVVGN